MQKSKVAMMMILGIVAFAACLPSCASTHKAPKAGKMAAKHAASKPMTILEFRRSACGCH